MSLAATSIRGARLNARFAVNGIQSSSSDGCAAVTSADVGLAEMGMTADCGRERRWVVVNMLDRDRSGEAIDDRRRRRTGGGPATTGRDPVAEARPDAVDHRATYRRNGNRCDRWTAARAPPVVKESSSQALQTSVVAPRAAPSAKFGPAGCAGTARAMEKAPDRRPSTSAPVFRPRPRAATLPHGGAMADVQIQQTPETGSGGGAGWVWALVVLILLAIVAWF